VDGFIVRDVYTDDDRDNDRIIIETVNGNEELSVRDFLSQYITDGFTKEQSQKTMKNDMGRDDELSAQEKPHAIAALKKEINAMFNEEAKQKYLRSFSDLSKEQVNNKVVFFERTHKKVLKMILKDVRSGKKIEDIGAYISTELLGGNLYDKIRVIFDKNINTKKTSMAFDPEKNPHILERDVPQIGKTVKSDQIEKKIREEEQYGWSDDDKKKFDTEWNKIADKKSEAKKATNELVDDPEAAALGGFDRNQEDHTTVVSSDTVSKDENVEPARIDPETVSERETSDNRTGDDQILVQEAEHRNQEELKNDLEDARRHYARLHYKNEGMINKIKAVFGHFDTSQDKDVTTAKNEYKNALIAYRDSLLSDLDHLSDDQKKARTAEVHAFDINEHINLYQERVAVKAEQYPAVGKIALKAIEKYKGIPTKYKIAFSVALLAGGTIAGVGAAAGVFGTMAIGKRVLGAGAAGVGAAGWMEARAQRKDSEQIQNALEAFGKQDMENQMAQLQKFDDSSFQKIEEAFYGKVAGRRNQILVGIAAVAGVMSAGSVAHAFMAEETTAESALHGDGSESVQQEQGTSLRSELTRDAAGSLHAKAQLARDFAHQMGITDTDNLKTNYIGNVPVEINGQSVPEHLYTDEQKKNIEIAKSVGAMMSGEQVLNDSAVKSDPVGSSHVIESVKIDNINEIYGEPLPDDGEQSSSFENAAYLRAEAEKAFEQYKITGNFPEIDEGILSNAGINVSGENYVGKKMIDGIFDNAQNISRDMTMDQLSATDNMDARNAMAGVMMRAAVKFGEDGMIRQDESIGSYLERLDSLYRPSADMPDTIAATVATEEGVQTEQLDSVPQYTNEAQMAAMEQSDESARADNPFIQRLTGIEHVEGNVGELTIEKGGSVEKTLIQFLTQNKEHLTAGNMGWDPEKFDNVQEWAQKRAHVLAQEYARAHEGFDIDTVQPGTKIILDINDPADIKTDIDFAGNGPHIEAMEAKTVMGASEQPASPVEEATNEGQSAESTTDPAFETMSEVEIMQALREQPNFDQTQFLRLVGTHIQHTLGASSLENVRNIAGTKIELLRPAEGVMATPGMQNIQQSLEGVIGRAQEVFGDEIGKPRPNATVRSYFTRIIARAELMGKTQEIFP
jgi:hypothetical protein